MTQPLRASRRTGLRWLACGCLLTACGAELRSAQLVSGQTPGSQVLGGRLVSSGDMLVTTSEPGTRGGRLVTALRAEPRTFNPVMAVDAPSRDVIRRLHADLVTINRETQQTELGLARAVERSPDGRAITVRLRRGLAFSDGHAFDADDVVFSFSVYLDEAVGSPQRELLIVHGEPVRVEKIDALTVRFTFAAPYGPGERVFDSVAMLPKHVLEPELRRGALAKAWGVGVEPNQVVGLGPFRLTAYRPGQALTLQRNPHYWKRDRRGTRLPYLEELRFVFAPNEDAQALRFEAGDLDLVDRLGAEQFQRLVRTRSTDLDLRDLGPGLDYTFLMFNLNELPGAASDELKHRQRWFSNPGFRQAISLAVDRQSVARLAYGGLATPQWWHVSSGNRLWFNQRAPRPARAVAEARRVLASSGFSWSAGQLVDAAGRQVTFSIMTSSANVQRAQTATLLQADLGELGIAVTIASLEFGSLLERVLRTHDYDAAVMGLAAGDVDPGPQISVWSSKGATHLWRLHASPQSPAERELDQLLDQQLATVDQAARKSITDRIQTVVATDLPVITLVGPHVLVGTKRALGNVRPGIIDHHLLWNADELYWRANPRPRQ